MTIAARLLPLFLTVFSIAGLNGCKSSSTGPGPNNPGSGNAFVKLELRGVTGQEGGMQVRYTIADTLISRAAESVIPRASLLEFCDSPGSTVTCDISVPVGKSITFYAYEGFEGVFTPTATMLPAQKGWHEFVAFTGDCSQTSSTVAILKGDCGLQVTSARTYNVRVDFALMPEVRVFLHGMTAYTIEIPVRDILQMPVRNLSPPSGASGGPAKTLVIGAQAWFPAGTTIKLTAKPNNQAQFVRWEGCLAGSGGGNPVCLVSQGTPTTSASVRLFHEHWACPDGSITDAPHPACTKVIP